MIDIMRRFAALARYAAWTALLPTGLLIVAEAGHAQDTPVSPGFEEEQPSFEFAPEDPEDAPVAAPASPDPATPEPGPAPSEAQPATSVAENDLPRLRVWRKKDHDSIFGSYRVRLTLARPDFDDGARFYDFFYGKTRWYPTISADWFAFDWYATLGLSFRMSYYTAEGHAAKAVPGKQVEDYTEADLVKDEAAPLSLTVVPLQVLLAAEMTPFARKWVVLDGWIGIERAYFQEVRTTPSDSNSALIAADSDQSDDSLTNKGWKNATVIGVAANILLNPLDQAAVSSMRGAMKLGYMYLTPFMEIVRTTSREGVSFGRTTYGLGFTFESVN